MPSAIKAPTIDGQQAPTIEGQEQAKIHEHAFAVRPPQRLSEVPGQGPKRTAMIGRAWEEQEAIKEVMLFLQGVGVSTSLAVRIYKTCAT